ncbi:MAG: phosphotransferase family protein [Kangiellaceae bacterium]|nr:phosphotransferase family protein [Kangiellaceae bacterium]
MTSSNHNYSQETRKSDQFDLDKLAIFLNRTLPDFIQSDKYHVKQFAGGASNLTYLLTSGELSMILRRPPKGTKAKSAHDMVREHHMLQQVSRVYSLSPKPILVCDDESILGEKFFLMEQIKGLGVDRNLPVEMEPSTHATLCENFVKGLVELHQVDINNPEIASLGKPEGYVERQLEGWQGRYQKAKTDDVPDSHQVYQWLKKNLNYDSGHQSLIHNDYKFDNLILDSENTESIIGVLDWEMATLGDPLLDLGCTLAYWVEATDPAHLQALRMMPTHLEGMFTRQQITNYYCQLRGITPVDFTPYYVFGLFRLAVIIQQIYYRFYHGQTDNPKFKDFGQLVKILLSQCEHCIQE